jgi:hypothetical protein
VGGEVHLHEPRRFVETVDLGSAEMSQDTPYHVVEIRSVLVAPET